MVVFFNSTFDVAGGCTILGLSFGFGATFCGRISAFGSGAFGIGLGVGGFGVGGLAFGGAGGGGGGFLVRDAFCSCFAVLGLSPSIKFVVGTDCTISITTIVCSTGRSRLSDGKPIHASTAMLTCNPSEIISERRSISSLPQGVSSNRDYCFSGNCATKATFSNPADWIRPITDRTLP